MNMKMSKQGITTLMMVFNNGFINMVTGKNADMTEVFSNLQWYIEDGELMCENPPILDLGSILSDSSEEE